MPKNLTLLSLLIVVVTLFATGAFIFEAPIIVTKVFSLASAFLFVAEKLGAK